MAPLPAGKIRCTIVTPEGQLADEECRYVVATAYDGQVGIQCGHAPLLCKLGEGLLRIDRDDSSSLYYVGGGFAEVADDVVTVITTEAILANRLTPAQLAQGSQTAMANAAKTAEDQRRNTEPRPSGH